MRYLFGTGNGAHPRLLSGRGDRLQSARRTSSHHADISERGPGGGG